MKISAKLLIALAVAIAGFVIAKTTDSTIGYVLHYIGSAATIIILIKWLNSTNRD